MRRNFWETSEPPVVGGGHRKGVKRFSVLFVLWYNISWVLTHINHFVADQNLTPAEGSQIWLQEVCPLDLGSFTEVSDGLRSLSLVSDLRSFSLVSDGLRPQTVSDLRWLTNQPSLSPRLDCMGNLSLTWSWRLRNKDHTSADKAYWRVSCVGTQQLETKTLTIRWEIGQSILNFCCNIQASRKRVESKTQLQRA